MHWTLRALLTLLLAVAGLVLGLRLAGPLERETALGDVALRVVPAFDGGVDAFIPLADWGVRADAFAAPLVIHVEPRTIDRQAVIRASGGDTEVLSAAQRDGQRAARDALLRALLWGTAGALVVGLLAARLTGTRWAWGVAVGGVAALLAGASLLLAQRTFDAKAFETPRFYARGSELAQLLKVAGRAQRKTSDYRNQVDRTLSSYAALLSAGGRPGLAPPGRRALLISDLHANTLVLDTIERVAAGGPVFIAGDFGQAGTAAEARLLVDRVAALGEVIAVSGNHDSRLFMRRLAAAGVTVLETADPPVRVAGVLVAGYSDPLESRSGDPDDADRIFSFSELPDFQERWAQAKQDVVAWFEQLSPRPDVVLIHHNDLAEALALALMEEGGPQLLILSGHDHIQHVDRFGRTLVVDAGTAGAGGVLGAGKDPIGIAQLELVPGQAWPRVIDLMELEPISGRAQADRVLPASADVCDTGRVKCHEVDEEAPEEPQDPPER